MTSSLINYREEGTRITEYTLPATAGNLVSDKLETLVSSAFALNALARNISKGPRLITSITTFATGVSYAATGNFVVGVPLVAVGAAEAINTLMHAPSVDIRNILDDSRAGLDMIQVLSKANIESFAKLDLNLSQVEENLEQLNTKITEIRSIATEGNAEVEAQKNKAEQLINKSKDLFENARKELISTENEMKKAGHQFGRVSHLMSRMIELIQNKEGDLNSKLAEFETLAVTIRNICNEGVDSQNLATFSFTKAMESLHLANQKQAEAFKEFGKALELGQNNLVLIATKAEYENSTKALVSQARQEVVVMNERTKDTDHLIQRLHTKMDQIEQKMNDGPSWSQVFSGTVMGGTAAYAIAAGPITGPALVMGGILLVNKNKDLFGLKAEQTFTARPISSVKKQAKSLVSYEFASKSTGFWGRFVEKRQSWTVGTVSIKAGNEEIKMSFDANAEGDSKIADRHQYELLMKLSLKVKEGTLLAEDCLAIINQLERIEINRKGSGKDNLVGFIPPRSPYFRELERQCLKIINSVNHST